MKKILALVLTIVLVMTATIAGTLAYLQSTSNEVKNTFTVGNVKITLAEENGTNLSGKGFKVSPGDVVPKDPTVTVASTSEECYVFVRITEVGSDWGTDLTYAVSDKWEQLKVNGSVVPGVYVYKTTMTAGQSAAILAENQVVVSPDMEALDDEAGLNFIAYAIQSANMNNAADAWVKGGF